MNNTVQRRVILEELRSVKTHPTADQVYDMARRKIPNISLATVYRNLEKMADNGDILRLETAGTKKRYDGDISRHYHLRCSKCGGVSDIKAESVRRITAALNQVKNVEGIEDFSLEFKGICHECVNKRPK